MGGEEDELQARLAALQRGYTQKLRDRLELLRELTGRARAGDCAALADATREAHKLHGTAGSYGFGGVSATVGEVEVILEGVRQGGDETPAVWDAVSELIQRALADASISSSVDPADPIDPIE